MKDDLGVPEEPEISSIGGDNSSVVHSTTLSPPIGHRGAAEAANVTLETLEETFGFDVPHNKTNGELEESLDSGEVSNKTVAMDDPFMFPTNTTEEVKEIMASIKVCLCLSDVLPFR